MVNKYTNLSTMPGFSKPTAGYPLVSVIITLKNESTTIERCLLAIFNQTYPNFELIIVDARSTDDSYQRIVNLCENSKQYTNLKRVYYCSIDSSSPANGRNVGVKQALGSIVAFTDGDCVADKEWLDNLVWCFNEETEVAGGPNVIQHSHESRLFTAIDKAFESKFGSGGSPQFLRIKEPREVYGVPSCNMAISKKLFKRIGGFDESLRFNEDGNLCDRLRRQGYRILYNPNAAVKHFNNLNSYGSLVKFIFNYGFQRGKNVVRDRTNIKRFHYYAAVYIATLLTIASVSVLLPSYLTSSILVAIIIASIIAVTAISINSALHDKGIDIPLVSVLIAILITIFTVYNSGLYAGILTGLFRKERCQMGQV